MTAYETIRDAIKQVIITADPVCPAANIYDYIIQSQDTSAERIYQLFGMATDNGNEIRAWRFTKMNRSVDANQTQSGTGSMQEREINETWSIQFMRTKLDPVNGGIDDVANSEYEFQNVVEELVDQLWEHPSMAALKRLNIRAVVASTNVPMLEPIYLGGEIFVHYAVIECGIHYNRYVSP